MNPELSRIIIFLRLWRLELRVFGRFELLLEVGHFFAGVLNVVDVFLRQYLVLSPQLIVFLVQKTHLLKIQLWRHTFLEVLEIDLLHLRHFLAELFGELVIHQLYFLFQVVYIQILHGVLVRRD